MSLLSSSIGGVRFHADEDADHNMLQGKNLDSHLDSRVLQVSPVGLDIADINLNLYLR